MGKITPDIERVVKRYLRKTEPVDLGIKGYVYIPNQPMRQFVVSVEHSRKYAIDQPFYTIYLYYATRVDNAKHSLQIIPTSVTWGKRENVYWYVKEDVEACDLKEELSGLVAYLETIDNFGIVRGGRKHDWAATDSQGYCMECARCGTYINIEGYPDENGETEWDKEVDNNCPIGFENDDIAVAEEHIVCPKKPKGDYSLKIKVIIEHGIVQAVLKNQDIPAEVEIIDLDCDYDDYEQLDEYRKRLLQDPDYIGCDHHKSDFTDDIPF